MEIVTYTVFFKSRLSTTFWNLGLDDFKTALAFVSHYNIRNIFHSLTSLESIWPLLMRRKCINKTANPHSRKGSSSIPKRHQTAQYANIFKSD